MRTDKRSWAAYLAFPLFIAALLVLLYALGGDLVALFRDREATRAWIQARGAYGRLAFVGLQALQVFLFVIPGEVVQVAGGYIFGLWEGTLLSLLGIAAGSLFNFGAGRLLGRPFIEAVFRRRTIEGLERVTNSGRAAAGFFLLFVIPGIPKDALCYLSGASRLSFPLFALISTLGRLPGILGSSFMGSAAYDGSYAAALVVLAVASSLFFVGLVFKERIESFLARLLRRGPSGRSAEEGASPRREAGGAEAGGPEAGRDRP